MSTTAPAPVNEKSSRCFRLFFTLKRKGGGPGRPAEWSTYCTLFSFRCGATALSAPAGGTKLPPSLSGRGQPSRGL
ncbi:unnamed protein product [Linum trigynum]|uniref:Uncharacterized protein n=1 Tax=Linum trigynum TaxID=586398 RepID=A0AAV2G2M2_9ROSI